MLKSFILGLALCADQPAQEKPVVSIDVNEFMLALTRIRSKNETWIKDGFIQLEAMPVEKVRHLFGQPQDPTLVFIWESAAERLLELAESSEAFQKNALAFIERALHAVDPDLYEVLYRRITKYSKSEALLSLVLRYIAEHAEEKFAQDLSDRLGFRLSVAQDFMGGFVLKLVLNPETSLPVWRGALKILETASVSSASMDIFETLLLGEFRSVAESERSEDLRLSLMSYAKKLEINDPGAFRNILNRELERLGNDPLHVPAGVLKKLAYFIPALSPRVSFKIFESDLDLFLEDVYGESFPRKDSPEGEALMALLDGLEKVKAPSKVAEYWRGRLR